VTQASDMGQQNGWGWPCPYCRATNQVDALRCAHCGSQLREQDEDGLFTTAAADYAEVVPPEVPFTRDTMWSTDANADGALGTDFDIDIDIEDAVGDSELVDDVLGDDLLDDEPIADDDVWDQEPLTADSTAFTAEPTRRRPDVVDEPFGADDYDAAPRRSAGTSPFASGRSTSSRSAPEFDQTPFVAPVNGGFSGAGHDPFTAPIPGPFAGAAASAPMSPPPRFRGPQVAPSWADPRTSSPSSDARNTAPVPDAHGLAAAVALLRPEAAEAAEVPISVCGALLARDEVVLGAVTGQMLGHPAVVVLTNQRVIIVNARRWQPIVDIFGLTPDLVVRGRHDRDIASLTFAQGEQLSTIDAIAEVALAVELAERIRAD